MFMIIILPMGLAQGAFLSLALLRLQSPNRRLRHSLAALDAATRRLERIAESEQLYLDPELTLTRLAERLGLREQELSRVLNQGLGMSFYDWLTEHRLRHVEALLAGSSDRDRKILNLAYEAGFNSKAVFYRAFRAKHGTTPTAYRDRRPAWDERKAVPLDPQGRQEPA